MERLYQDKFNIASTRLPGWNYGDDGYYFVTICANNREEYFGDVLIDNDGIASVALSDVGNVVRDLRACPVGRMDYNAEPYSRHF